MAKKARYQRQHDKCDAMRNFHFHSAVKERKKEKCTDDDGEEVEYK